MMPKSVISGRGNTTKAAGVYASTKTNGAHGASPNTRAHALTRSAVTISDSGV
jgi:hypothetical protein